MASSSLGFLQLEAFLAADPRHSRAALLLAADSRAGWDLFALLLTAREAVGGQFASGALVCRSARALADHRFFKSKAFN